MITDNAVLLDGSAASLSGVTLVTRKAAPVRPLQPGQANEGSTAVTMHIRLLETPLSEEDRAEEPDAAEKKRAQTPDEADTLPEEDETGARDAVMTEARVVPTETPEVFPATVSDAVPVTPARSVEYRVSEPPHADIVLVPEQNTLDLTA